MWTKGCSDDQPLIGLRGFSDATTVLILNLPHTPHHCLPPNNLPPSACTLVRSAAGEAAAALEEHVPSRTTLRMCGSSCSKNFSSSSCRNDYCKAASKKRNHPKVASYWSKTV